MLYLKLVLMAVFWNGAALWVLARAAQFINLVPPIAVTESVLILGEPMTPALYVGAALVVAGLYLHQQT